MTPRPSRSPRSPRTITAARPGVSLPRPPTDPNEVTPATREETFPIAVGAMLLGFIALYVCVTRGYILLYGDAVAHLAIARRIFDSRNPGLAQLGGVWLPLPHILMLPFVSHMDMWQNGLAGAWPSLLCYIASVAGFYRVCRRLLIPRWAFAATAFYALNPNLLYLSTTAMTEPVFLAILVWMTLLTIELTDAIRAGEPDGIAPKLIFLGLAILAAVFTRYDGWVLGAAAWCVVAWSLWRAPEVRRRVTPAFAVCTILAVAGPLLWLWYNQHFYHDPLDFMRGPYSAPAIEKKTSPPGSRHYRGWHNPAWALLFFTRTAQIDAAAWETGFAVLATALAGLWIAVRRRIELAALLLWIPLAFYVYSIAYGSVPIFIPELWPHSYYNARYGMELLPALALFLFIAVAAFERRLTTPPNSTPATPGLLFARLLHPVVLALVVLNSLGMIYLTPLVQRGAEILGRKDPRSILARYSDPLVLKEAKVNAVTRIAFEQAIARFLETLPPGVPILMSTSDHVGALQDAGIPLKQTLNDGDRDSWNAALADPAGHAAFVVAIAGDAVSKAVAEHPDGLKELTILCTTGQPCARIYESERLPPTPPSR